MKMVKISLWGTNFSLLTRNVKNEGSFELQQNFEGKFWMMSEHVSYNIPLSASVCTRYGTNQDSTRHRIS